MKLSISLRAQVAVIAALLAVAALSATLYTARTVSEAQESILRLNRERLSSLTSELARRYGAVLTFIAPDQVQDTALVFNAEFQAIITGITRETLADSPDVDAGLFHLPSRTPLGGLQELGSSFGKPSPQLEQFFYSVLQRAEVEQGEQAVEFNAAGIRALMIAKPVLARARLVGIAWSLDDLTDELSHAWSVDRTPLLLVVVIAGIVLAAVFLIALRREVRSMQHGLEAMKRDLSVRLTPSGSELGTIAQAINQLAETVQRQQQEKESLQQAIQQNEKLASLGQVVAGVAHEIRTPLAAIKTRVQLWQRGIVDGRKLVSPDQNPVSEASMHLVVGELNRMERIVQKLLYFARERRLAMSQVNLHELLDSLLTVLGDTLKQRHVRLERRFEASPVNIRGDAGELREVFMNLFTNAVDAMPHGGTLNVETMNAADMRSVVITVEDTGEGVHPDVAGRMFDPFYTTKETGTGLGLSIAYEIVRAHAGRIEYIPTENGCTRFVVILPLAERSQVSEFHAETHR